MNGDPSTPYSRDLGDELRQVRERFTTFRSRKIARMLGWDPGKVSNIEHGKVRATEIDLIQYLGRCGRSQKFIEDFLNRYRSAFDHYFVQVPTNLRTVTMAEASADKITSYNLTAVPGLMQTEDYATAHFEAGTIAPDEIAAAVRFRMERQAILRRPNRPLCTFYIQPIAGGPQWPETAPGVRAATAATPTRATSASRWRSPRSCAYVTPRTPSAPS